MPNPQTLISAYPSIEISDLIKEQKPKKLNVYIDLKNVMVSLFVEDVAREIVLNSRNMQNLDSSIFQSVVNISAYWIRYGKERGLGVEVFVCSDIGQSSYHLEIYKKYKYRRQISNIDSWVCGPEIKKVRDKNFLLCDMICNKIPHVYFFCLKYLEADFLPYYLITRKYKNNKDILHIVCSNDKDLYQTAVDATVVQLYKLKGQKNILKFDTILGTYTKFHKSSVKNQVSKLNKLAKIDPKYIVAMMAVCGDAGDDIPGIKGMGTARVVDMFAETEVVNKILGSPEDIDNRVAQGGKLFKEDVMGVCEMPNIWRKVFIENDLVTKSFKMISFEMLCRWMEKKDNLNKINYIKYMDKLLDKSDIKMIPSTRSFFKPLQKMEGLCLTEDIIDSFF